LAMITRQCIVTRIRAKKKRPHQCEKRTYRRLDRLVLVWSATASSFTPTSPIELCEMLRRVDMNRRHSCTQCLSGDGFSVGDGYKAMCCDEKESRKEMPAPV
jgi:hypothetical protein